MFFFSSRRRHTRCALVTGVQTCALPISRNVEDAGQPLLQRHVTKAAPPVVRLRASWPRATGSAHRPAIDTRALSHPSSSHGRGPPPRCRPNFLLVAGPFRRPSARGGNTSIQTPQVASDPDGPCTSDHVASVRLAAFVLAHNTGTRTVPALCPTTHLTL